MCDLNTLRGFKTPNSRVNPVKGKPGYSLINPLSPCLAIWESGSVGKSICASTRTRIKCSGLVWGHPGRFLGGGNDPQSPIYYDIGLGQPGLDSRVVASLLAFSPLLGLPVCPHLASRTGKALQRTKVKGTDQLGGDSQALYQERREREGVCVGGAFPTTLI